MSYIIYKATHQRNGRVYIGITSQNLEERIYNHRVQANSAIYNEVRKGLMHFEVIDSACDRHQALGKESYYITQFNSLAPNGYNRVKSNRYVVGHAQQTPEEMKEAQRKKREERRLIRSGKIRTIPSISDLDAWSSKSFIKKIRKYEGVKYQQYVLKEQKQYGGLSFNYSHRVLYVFPIHADDDDLIQTDFVDAFHDGEQWVFHDRLPSYRSITSNIWDWIYDYTDAVNHRYRDHRNMDSCDFHPWTIDYLSLISDYYCFPITVEDYLSGRK